MQTAAVLSWQALGLVAMGGAAGSVARYVIAAFLNPPPPAVLGMRAGYPIGTLAVNLAGALLIGVMLGWMERTSAGTQLWTGWKYLIIAGFLGGFTTFSALALETLQLFAAGRQGTAVAYAVTTMALGPVMALGGWGVAR
jgi:fluoride exporter